MPALDFLDSESSHAPGLLAVGGPAGGWTKILGIPLIFKIYYDKNSVFLGVDKEDNSHVH